MPPFLITNLKSITIIAAIIIYGGAIWHVHSIYDKAEQVEELTKEIAQHHLDQMAANEHASDLEKKLAKNRQRQAGLTDEMEKAYETIPSDCNVPDNVIRLLNSAIPDQDGNPG